jgi:MFS family permease
MSGEQRPVPPSAEPAGAPQRPVRYSQVLRQREFRGLIGSQVLSELGDQVARVAVASLVLARSDSVLLTALTFAVSYLPMTAGSAILGSLADRVPRKLVLLGADAARAVTIGLLAVAAHPGVSLVVVFTLLLVAETFSAPYLAARRAILPDVLPRPREYLAGAGLERVLTQADQVIGIVAAGIIVAATSTRMALAVDAATFVGSFLILAATVVSRPAASASAQAQPYFRALLAGARLVAGDVVRRTLVLLGCGAAFVLVAPETVALAYARERGMSPFVGSLLMATIPAGAALGTYLIGRAPPLRQVRLITTLVGLACLPLLATFVAPPVPVAAALWLVSGACQGFMVPLVTTVTLATPPDQRGLVNGLASAAFTIATSAAYLVTGLLSDLTSTAVAVGILGAAGLVVTVVARWHWPHRALRRVALRWYAGPPAGEAPPQSGVWPPPAPSPG